MGRIVSPKTQARALAARQRAARVITLLAEGQSQRHVAREVGLTQPRVCQILKATLREIRHETADRLVLYRARQLVEIESLRAAIFPRAVGVVLTRKGQVGGDGVPNVAAIGAMLRLHAREAALLGLDAAARDGPAVSSHGKPVDANGAAAFDLSRLTPDELRQWEALHGKVQSGAAEATSPKTERGSD
jgi:predicted XRE-type DNA-binding protein